MSFQVLVVWTDKHGAYFNFVVGCKVVKWHLHLISARVSRCSDSHTTLSSCQRLWLHVTADPWRPPLSGSCSQRFNLIDKELTLTLSCCIRQIVKFSSSFSVQSLHYKSIKPNCSVWKFTSILNLCIYSGKQKQGGNIIPTMQPVSKWQLYLNDLLPYHLY